MLPGEGGQKLEAARIAAAADASLKRLGVDAIDLYYAHQDDPDTPMEETLRAFDALVQAGKVKVLGASNFTAERLAEALATSARLGTARYEVLQPEYHLLAREGFEAELQPLCMAEEVGVLPYYGLASGFLTGKYRSREDFGKSVRGGRMERFWNDRGFAVLSALDEVAAEAEATPAQVALAWIAAQPGLTAPIASARTPEQLEEIIGAMTLDLTEAQLGLLNEASRT
jgi:aryl-alcohol dehydrogenase-like predicted oxidoreductase